ncbi:MAG: heavy metal-associated domain-containing protein [Oscillospiraceae bacterium]|nr:heavy metal-associated domain-containing protein [Oscillospiraceae bacterium]
MIITTVKVDGMMCGMCEAHVAGAIRNAFPDAKKVSASRAKKEATFLSEEAPDEKVIKDVITATGYDCLSVSSEEYVKKGLFSFR